MVDGEGKAGQCHECIACKHYTPGESRNEVHSVAFAHIELLGTVLKTVEKRSTRSAACNLGFIHLLKATGAHRAHTGREDYALAFLDGHFEITGNPEIFGIGNTSLEILHIFDVFVPVRLVDPFSFMAELHVQRRESVVETCGDTIGHRFDGPVYGIVLNAQAIHFAESEEWLETQ